MRRSVRLALAACVVIAAAPALAQSSRGAWPADRDGFRFMRTLPLGYDTGGDNDRHPQLPGYQQGGGQQTGGPARNRIPGDTLHASPR